MAIYRFAGLTVDMEPRFPTLTERAAPYLLPDAAPPADIVIRTPDTPVDERTPGMNDDTFEYLFATGYFYRALLAFDGMMLHASAVLCDGKAYLFSAPPGTGKSTHTAGWLRLLGDRARILNDDKPALRLFPDGRLLACGTPFSGTSPLNANVCAPVGGICFLARGTVNRITPITAEEAIPMVYDQTVRRLPKAAAVRLLDVMDMVVSRAPFWRMECTIGDEAVRTAFEAMVGAPLPGM